MFVWCLEDTSETSLAQLSYRHSLIYTAYVTKSNGGSIYQSKVPRTSLRCSISWLGKFLKPFECNFRNQLLLPAFSRVSLSETFISMVNPLLLLHIYVLGLLLLRHALRFACEKKAETSWGLLLWETTCRLLGVKHTLTEKHSAYFVYHFLCNFYIHFTVDCKLYCNKL